MEYVLAIDIGGTHTTTCIVDNLGNIYPKNPKPELFDSEADKDYILGEFSARIIKTQKGNKNFPIKFLGVAYPGFINYKTGVVLKGHLKRLSSIAGANLKEYFKDATGLDSYFFNDADAYVLGESWKGAGAGYKRVMGVTLGTGLGAGFVVDGRIKRGEDGSAKDGEIFNQKFHNSILEDYISTRGIENIYKEMHSVKTSPSVKEMAKQADAGDKTAQEIFKKFGGTIAEGLAPAINKFNPDIFVFGGRISNAFELFAPTVEEKLKNMLKKPPVIVKAQLGDLAPLYGAAALTFQELDMEYK